MFATYSRSLPLGAMVTLAFQPLNHCIGEQTEKNGGNAMGLTGKDHDRLIIEIAGVYSRASDDAAVQAVSRKYTDAIIEDLKKNQANAKIKGLNIGDYNPYFMNDAGPDQHVMGSFRDAMKFEALQKSVDPTGFFAKRAGGYKYSPGQ
jgi:hypothetical protein